jgi:hypothetical protein
VDSACLDEFPDHNDASLLNNTFTTNYGRMKS